MLLDDLNVQGVDGVGGLLPELNDLVPRQLIRALKKVAKPGEGWRWGKRAFCPGGLDGLNADMAQGAAVRQAKAVSLADCEGMGVHSPV